MTFSRPRPERVFDLVARLAGRLPEAPSASAPRSRVKRLLTVAGSRPRRLLDVASAASD
jgi:hypothetical protein